MDTEADAVLGVSVDPSGAEQGRDRAVRSLNDIRQEARKMASDIASTNETAAKSFASSGNKIQDSLRKTAHEMAATRAAASGPMTSFTQTQREMEQFRRAQQEQAALMRQLRSPSGGTSADAIRDLDDELTGLLSSIDPVYRGQKKLDEGFTLLDEGLRKGLISQQQYDRSLLLLKERYGQVDTAARGFSTRAIAIGSAIGTLAGTAFYRLLNMLQNMPIEFVKQANAWDMFHKRIEAATAQIGNSVEVFQDLRSSVIEIGGSMEAAVSLFQNIDRAAGSLGVSDSQITRFVDLAQKTGAISGASFNQMSAGLLQLSQGLSLGVLRGQDLRSVIEQIPELANQIAKGLGVTVARLREMGASGELTGRKVFDALLGQASEIDKTYTEVGNTLSRALGALLQTTEAQIDHINQKLDITAKLAALIKAVTPAPPKTQEQSLADQISQTRNDLGIAKAEPGNVVRGLIRRSLEERLKKLLAQQGAAIRDSLDKEGGVDIKTRERTFTGAKQSFEQILKDLDPQYADRQKLDQFAKEAERALGLGATTRQRFDETMRKIAAEQRKLRSPAETAMRQIEDERDAAGLSALEKQRLGTRNRFRDTALTPGQVSANVERGSDAFFRDLERKNAATALEAKGQEALAKATLEGAEAVRKQAIENKVLIYQFEQFGNAKGPKVTAAMSEYRSAVTRASEAERDLSLAQSKHQATLAADNAEKLAAASRDGSEAVRQASLEIKAHNEALKYAKEGTEAFTRSYREFLDQFRREDIANQTAQINQYAASIDRLVAGNRAVMALRGSGDFTGARIEGAVRQQAKFNVDLPENAAATAKLRISVTRGFVSADRVDHQATMQALRSEIELEKKANELRFAAGPDRAAELAYLQTKNELIQAGTTLTDQQIEQQAQLSGQLARLRTANQEWAQTVSDSANAIGTAFEDAILNGSKLREVLSGLAQDLARIALRKAFTKPLEAFVGSILPFEGGGIMTSHGPLPLRKYVGGGIADSPQLAMFAEGSVPEAYVPVPNGKIPVELRGGGAPKNININVTVNAPTGGANASAEGARRIGAEIARQLKGVIVDVIIEQQRPGGVLSGAT